jgi:hypothetical protein
MMAADSDSKIAWHRTQLRKNREALKNLETGWFAFGEISGSRHAAQQQKAIAELKRKIRESEQIVAAYHKETQRPRGTDFRSLASVPWSKWNAIGT